MNPDFIIRRPFNENTFKIVRFYNTGNENSRHTKQFDKANALLAHLPEKLKTESGQEIMHLQSEVYRRQKNWDKALEITLALLEQHKDTTQYYLDAGTVYQEMGRNDEAEKLFRQALKIGPDDPEAYNTLGYFYAETNQKLDEALELVNRAIKLKPDAGHIMDSLGWVLYRRGDYQGAVDKLSAAIKMMEKTPDPVVFDHLGDAYDKLGKSEEAREAWRKALAIDQSNEKIKKKLESDKTLESHAY